MADRPKPRVGYGRIKAILVLGYDFTIRLITINLTEKSFGKLGAAIVGFDGGRI